MFFFDFHLRKPSISPSSHVWASRFGLETVVLFCRSVLSFCSVVLFCRSVFSPACVIVRFLLLQYLLWMASFLLSVVSYFFVHNSLSGPAAAACSWSTCSLGKEAATNECSYPGCSKRAHHLCSAKVNPDVQESYCPEHNVR